MAVTARGDAPKTLQTIAYISIPDSADLEFLLWDLQDAVAAYARLSGTALPRPVDTDATQTAGPADGIVLAVEDELYGAERAAVEQALEHFGRAGTRVYAVVQAAGEGTGQAHEIIERLRKVCEHRDLAWCGGVVICAGKGIAALRHSPRMGLLRRPFSEAMDKLVGAVRMGCSIEHAQRLGGGDAGGVMVDGMVYAEPSLPTPIWRAATKRLDAGTRSNN